jgi:hypothetical protein
VERVDHKIWQTAITLSGLAILGLTLTCPAWAQPTYTIKRTTAPPVIDGVDTPGEWEGVEAAGDFQLLREPEGTADDHGIQFKALWDDDNLYVQLTSNDDGWNFGNEFEEDCAFVGMTCNMDWNSDNVNFYIDPNSDDEPNVDDGSIIDGYQIAFNVFDGESSYQDGIASNTGLFMEGHVNNKFGNQAAYSYETGADQWNFASQAGDSGAVIEVVFPWTTFGAEEGVDPGFEDGLYHPFAPTAGDEWLVTIGFNTADPTNFLPIWPWNPTQSFVSRPDGVWEFSDETVAGGPPQLQAGDADQNLEFNQLDLVKVQIAAKYLTGQPATWGEGDWDGAPGGKQGEPPTGDGQFSQLDIIAALNNGLYLQGPYAAITGGTGTIGDEQTSIVYNAGTGELSVDAPASTELTSINIDSAAGIFTGNPAENLGGSFDNDADENIFKATFGSNFGSLSFGTVAQTGLSEQFLRSDLTVVGSLSGGGALGDVDLIYIPEPSAILLLCVGMLGLTTRAVRRRFIKAPNH